MLRHWFIRGLLAALCIPGCSPAKPGAVDKLLSTTDDFELCDELFKLLLHHYGDDLDVSICKEKDQVVILTWHAHGIIDNGGFQYLFEGDFQGDLGFIKTKTAFSTIKAAACAEAMGEALALFPEAKPPSDIGKRLSAYQTVSEKKRRSIDRKFFAGSDEVKHLLAKFIRDNREEFKHLQ